MIWFIAGINGAGKSTLASNPYVRRELGGYVINPDEVARLIAFNARIEYRLANLAAAEITEGEVFDADAVSDKPLAIETVLSSDKFLPVLEIAESRAIEIGLVFVALKNVEMSLNRIRTRVLAGLHDVPEDRVRQRWPRTLANLKAWAPRVDKLWVFSNYDADRAPVLIARKSSKFERIEILDRLEAPEAIAQLET